MSTVTELQSQVDRLTQLITERDRQDAEARAAAKAARAATDEAKSADERAKAAAEERESIRRGSWVSVLLGKADPGSPVDLSEIQKAIPSDPNAWPDGVDPSSFVLLGGARIRPEEKKDIAATHLGKLLFSIRPKL